MEARVKEVQLERDRLEINKNYAESANTNLRDELNGVKNMKDGEIQSLRRDYEAKIK